VHRGDLDQAHRYTSAAVGIAQENGSGVVARKLAELHGALAALGADKRVRGIRDEIAGVTRGMNKKGPESGH
jgi:hypothetical protein